MKTPRAILLAFLACATAGLPARAVAGGFDLPAALASAKPGDEVRVPAGTYAGPVVIDKPLRLVAAGVAVIQGAGDGDVLRVTAPDVTVRGFVLRRTGTNLDRENAGIVISAARATVEDNRVEDALFGISLRDAPGSVIRNNDVIGKLDLDIARRGDGIKLWNSGGSLIERNRLSDCRDLVMWYSKNLVVRGNRVERCRYGIHFMFAGEATVEDNELRDNSVGIFLMYGEGLKLRRNVLAHNRGPSGYGLGLKDVDAVECHDNVFADNRVALHMDNSPARYDLVHTYSRNVFAYNDVALGLMPSVRNNRFVDNAFYDNVEQVAVFGGGNLKNNEFTVDGRGNYWSDYRGYDADGDGIGDVAHRSQSVFENLMDRQPKLRMFLFSPAQQAVELASRAFPVFKPQVRATDTAPLMHPVMPRVERSVAAASGAGNGWSGAGLLAGAGMLALGGIVVRTGLKEMGR